MEAMRSRTRPSGRGFATATGTALGVLVGWNLAYQVSAGLLVGGFGRPGHLVYQLPGWIGLFLPYAALAGGMAAHALLSPKGVLGRATAVAAMSYLLLAWASPTAIHHANASAGVDVATQYAFGPDTPGALRAQRAAVEADPPEEFSLRIDRPLEQPPNWLTYRIHTPLVMAGFALLAALLGYGLAGLTTGLSPPRRRIARLGLGLAAALAFFLALAAGGQWVRADPANAGVLGAWLPLLVPLAGLAVLEGLGRARDRTPISRS
jgi:hypothetical protein